MGERSTLDRTALSYLNPLEQGTFVLGHQLTFVLHSRGLSHFLPTSPFSSRPRSGFFCRGVRRGSFTAVGAAEAESQGGGMGNSPLKNARKKLEATFSGSSGSSGGGREDPLAPFCEPPPGCAWDQRSIRSQVASGELAPIVEGSEQKTPLRWVSRLSWHRKFHPTSCPSPRRENATSIRHLFGGGGGSVCVTKCCASQVSD